MCESGGRYGAWECVRSVGSKLKLILGQVRVLLSWHSRATLGTVGSWQAQRWGGMEDSGGLGGHMVQQGQEDNAGASSCPHLLHPGVSHHPDLVLAPVPACTFAYQLNQCCSDEIFQGQ